MNDQQLDNRIMHYIDVVIERFHDEFNARFEVLDDIRDKVSYIPTMRQDIAELKADMKTVKAAIAATNKDVAWLKAVAHTH